MKVSTIIAYVGVAGLAALGVVMAMTNPNQTEYEEYAVQRLTKYIKSNVCLKTPKFLENLIHVECDKLVESANPQMREIITESTHQQNFIIFSIYHTELNLNPLIPSYEFQTVGAFNSFYTYNAEQQ